MNILDNELVRKYFYEGPGINYAQHVLDAMQQPIRKGERFIMMPEFSEQVWDQSTPNNFHPYYLRLPDAFQKQECKCQCHMTACGCCVTEGHNQPTPSPEKCPRADIGHFHGDISNPSACPEAKPKDAVEEKIEYVQSFFDASDPRKDYARKHMARGLRDLVRIVREEK